MLKEMRRAKEKATRPADLFKEISGVLLSGEPQ
jgi:hypothetical protein